MMKKALILGFLLIIIGYTVFYFLGGTEPLNITLVNNDGYKLVGRYYEGRLNDKGLEEIFFEAKDYIAKGQLPGTLVVAYFNNPEKEGGFVKNLIGVEAPEAIQSLPRGYELRNIESTRAIRVSINAHSSVLPRPEEVQRQVQAFAKTQNVRLQDISIEKYLAENELIIEFPIALE